MIEETKAFRTSDGELFEIEENAKKHQSDIDTMEVCEQIADDMYYYGIDRRGIATWLFEHRRSVAARLVIE